MGSRLRLNPDKLFEVFAEVGRSEQEGEDPFILQKYPPDYDEQDVLNNIPKFSFPCRINTPQVDQFAFVLTDLESLYRFGFCRHGTGAQTCLCIISHLPWYEVFYKMLNFLAEIINRSENNDLLPFLKVAYEQSIPLAEEPVTIVAGQDMFNFTAPDTSCLPSIPASFELLNIQPIGQKVVLPVYKKLQTKRNLTEYYNAVDTNNMMRIFASMLHERRIVITSKKLSRVTACIHAAEALLYPMHWQHLYIPVLPEHLIDYVTAPMPYLIGVHTTLMEKIVARRMEIGDAVIVNADKNEVTTEYEDLEALPEDVSSYLKRHLKTQRVQTSMMDCGDAISRAFLQALVRLIGGYRDALRIRDGEPITFDRDLFVQSRSSQSMQVFLESMLQLQIFQQFINGRLELLNDGGGLTELFETESVKYADSLNTQSKYKEWLARVSKQKRKLKAGGKDIISDMKERAAPMMNTAVQSMKNQGKKVMSKMKEINEHKMSSRKVTGGIVHTRRHDRLRPSTIAGSNLSTTRPPRPPPASSPRPRTAGMTDRTDRGQGYRSQLSVEDDGSGSYDDSHLRLSYHSIDVSLMTDADIQNAMMRSASAEQLPVQDRDNSSPQSASEGDISSTPSSEALSPSDDNLTDIPYLDMASTSRSVPPFAPTSSSEEDLNRPTSDPVRPPPLPAKGTSVAADHLVPTDRLIIPKPSDPAPIAPPRANRRTADSRSTGSSPQPSPQLSRPPSSRPRRISQEKVGITPGDTVRSQTMPRPQPGKPQGQEKQEKPLIHFESSESEADGVEQFDPLHSKPQSRKSAQSGSPAADDSPPSSLQGLDRKQSSRSSLMRTAAFRRAPNDAPVRSGYRDDKGSSDNLTDLFDPLVGQSSPSSTSGSKPSDQTPTTLSQKGGVSGEGSGPLMHDWTLDHLSTGSGLSAAPAIGASFNRASSTSAGFSRVPSGGTLTCPTTAVPSFPRPVSPMTSMTSNPLYVAPTSGSGTHSNPLYQPVAGSPMMPTGGAINRSNPMYQLTKSSQPAPAPTGTSFMAWPPPSAQASHGVTSAGPKTGGQTSVSQRKLQFSGLGDGISPASAARQSQAPSQPKPPPARAWETFD